MIDHIKICQHNTARGREILQSFFEVALKEDALILCIQEPYLYYNKMTKKYSPLSHPSYIPIVPYQDASIRPRVITYIRRHCTVNVSPRLDIIEDPDMQIHQIDTPGESFYLLNIYNEKSHHLTESTLTIERLLQLDVNWDRPFLLLGDLNLHHLSWNPAINSPTQNAEAFASYMEKNHATLLNNFTIIEEFGGPSADPIPRQHQL